MSAVYPKCCFCLADFGVQMGIGACSGMLLAKVWPIITVLDGALIGVPSGIASGIVSRVILAFNPELQDLPEVTMRKVIFRVSNSLITFSFALAGHSFCSYLNSLGKGRVSVHG